MSRKVSPTLVGAFVIGAITIAVIAVMVFASGRFLRQTERFVLFFDGSVSGLRTGSPVKFRGVEVGQVRGIYLDLGDGRPDTENSIPVTVELWEDQIRSRGLNIDLGSEEFYNTAIEGGLRGQLLTESLVTGRLFVSLDIHPGSPVIFRGGPNPRYREIPTIPTAFQEIQQRATEFISELQKIEFDTIAASLAGMLDGMNQLVNSPEILASIESLDRTLQNTNAAVNDLRSLIEGIETEVLPVAANLDSTRQRAGAAAEELEATLASIRTMIEPGSPIAHQLEAALREISSAARALSALVEYLERDPSALIRGREAPKENR